MGFSMAVMNHILFAHTWLVLVIATVTKYTYLVQRTPLQELTCSAEHPCLVHNIIIGVFLFITIIAGVGYQQTGKNWDNCLKKLFEYP